MPAGPKRRATFIVARPGLSCKSRTKLLDFDGGDAFKLLLDGLRLVLGRALLQRLGGAVDQVLGFLQAERGDLANSLDGVDLVCAEVLENNLEFSLLFGNRCRCSAAGRNCDWGCRCGRDA